MKPSLFFCLLLLLLSACQGGKQHRQTAAQGDTIALRYADNLTLVAYPDYTVATLRNPWDTLHTLRTYVLVDKDRPLPLHLPQGTVVRTPLSKSLVYSSVHCSLLQKLGAQEAIGGVCDLNYIKQEYVQQKAARRQIVDCGNGMNPDIEKIIDLHPDAILLSPFENSGGYGRVEKLNIPLIECADYMETSPLGRAEWMRFYGLLFGAEARAERLFAEVDSCYGALKMQALLSSTSLSVFTELKSSSAWYVPGGRSTTGQLLADACSRYVFADNARSGSVPLAFETVFNKASEADVWTIKYHRDSDMTYHDLEADFAGYAAFKAFKERRVYGCNTARVPFYEETPFRPDYLLADFIRMLHPELNDSAALRYFTKLKER